MIGILGLVLHLLTLLTLLGSAIVLLFIRFTTKDDEVKYSSQSALRAIVLPSIVFVPVLLITLLDSIGGDLHGQIGLAVSGGLMLIWTVVALRRNWYS